MALYASGQFFHAFPLYGTSEAALRRAVDRHVQSGVTLSLHRDRRFGNVRFGGDPSDLGVQGIRL